MDTESYGGDIISEGELDNGGVTAGCCGGWNVAKWCRWRAGRIKSRTGSEASLVRNGTRRLSTTASKRTLASHDNVPGYSATAATYSMCQSPRSVEGEEPNFLIDRSDRVDAAAVPSVVIRQQNGKDDVMICDAEHLPSYMKLSRAMVGYSPYNVYSPDPTRPGAKDGSSTPAGEPGQVHNTNNCMPIENNLPASTSVLSSDNLNNVNINGHISDVDAMTACSNNLKQYSFNETFSDTPDMLSSSCRPNSREVATGNIRSDGFSQSVSVENKLQLEQNHQPFDTTNYDALLRKSVQLGNERHRENARWSDVIPRENCAVIPQRQSMRVDGILTEGTPWKPKKSLTGAGLTNSCSQHRSREMVITSNPVSFESGNNEICIGKSQQACSVRDVSSKMLNGDRTSRLSAEWSGRDQSGGVTTCNGIQAKTLPERNVDEILSTSIASKDDAWISNCSEYFSVPEQKEPSLVAIGLNNGFDERQFNGINNATAENIRDGTISPASFSTHNKVYHEEIENSVNLSSHNASALKTSSDILVASLIGDEHNSLLNDGDVWISEIENRLSEEKQFIEDPTLEIKSLDSSISHFDGRSSVLDSSTEIVAENSNAICNSTNGILLKDGTHFMKEVEQTSAKLTELCSRLECDLEGDLPDEVEGRIRAAVGKATLLTTKKFKQFKGLCEKNLTQDENEQFKTTSQDLAGFWDMVLIQVDDVLNLFQELDVLRSNGWKELNQQQDENSMISSGADVQGVDTLTNSPAPKSANPHSKSSAAKTRTSARGGGGVTAGRSAQVRGGATGRGSQDAATSGAESRAAAAARTRELHRQRLAAAKQAGRQRKASAETDEVEIFVA